MSFATYKKFIEDGDTVILHLGHDSLYPITIKKGETYQIKYGALRHNDLIGVQYGSKVNCPKGWLYVLHPTPELWTVCLPHRTQILYATDIAMIVMQLDLKPGGVVIESGTGSGSLSHSLIRTIAPTGHLHTFEFHKQRSEKAQEEFIAHGVSDYVTVQHRDVCEQGFDLEHVADAVFLDLPSPFKAIPFAKKAIKQEGGRICSFSPCIEQVQQTCDTLQANGFTDITTMECLLRTFDPRSVNMAEADLGETTENTDPESLVSIASESCDTHGKFAVNTKVDKHVGFNAAVPVPEIPGHTGYLTFASLY